MSYQTNCFKCRGKLPIVKSLPKERTSCPLCSYWPLDFTLVAPVKEYPEKLWIFHKLNSWLSGPDDD